LSLTIVTVDAFTDVRFAGNPAAVCLLPSGKADEGWMKKVAREMNLSETAFLRSRDGKNPSGRRRAIGAKPFDLRWFTSIVEVDLCGHATLASAHVLWEEGHVARRQKLHFHTRSGLLQKGASKGVRFGSSLTSPLCLRDHSKARQMSSQGRLRPNRDTCDSTARTTSSRSRESAQAPLSRLCGHEDAAGSGNSRDLSAECLDESEGLRLRLQILRPKCGDKRGSGDRLGALLPRPVLGEAPGEEGGPRLSGVCAQRLCEGKDAWRPRRPRWKGSHGYARGIAMEGS
jgi:Phenazine biosynthesis-like protein